MIWLINSVYLVASSPAPIFSNSCSMKREEAATGKSRLGSWPDIIKTSKATGRSLATLPEGRVIKYPSSLGFLQSAALVAVNPFIEVISPPLSLMGW